MVPIFAEFEGVADAGNYRPLPDDWALATADIVGSTKAIEAGRYKTVNTAGASVISALLNTLGRRDLPFMFGGDGAIVAFPQSAQEKASAALAAVQAWAADDLDLTLRGAIVPMKDIRAKGLDVRVARFQASEQVHYAMFTGGGASWAEAEMKAGRFRIEPAPSGTRPDLTGLSCRWDPIEAETAKSSRSSRCRRGRQSGKSSASWSRTSSRSPANRHAPAIRCRSMAPASAGRQRAWSWRPAPPRQKVVGCCRSCPSWVNWRSPGPRSLRSGRSQASTRSNTSAMSPGIPIFGSSTTA